MGNSSTVNKSKKSYNGVNLFEGTEPLAKGGTTSPAATAPGALAGVDPSDSGVDISAFFNAGANWSK